ncbi:MASE3 domain-containing protein [Chloroflexota bacterium]
MMNIRNPRWYFEILVGALGLFGLYLASLYNYLLFHSIAELFSIFVAFGIFIVAWHSRRFMENNFFIFIGVAYLFVGTIDLVHMLAYPGMGVFLEYGANLSTQLWIVARYVESLSLLIALLLIGRKLRINLLFLGYGVAISFLLISIFYWNTFPVCFVEGTGLTPFKIISEYTISLILLGSVVLLFLKRSEFEASVLKLFLAAIIVTIASELFFTLYDSPFGLPNLIGHFLKIFSFYLIYKAIIEISLVKPYDLLFRNLQHREEQYRDLYEEAPNAYFSIGADGYIKKANHSAVELLGYSSDELIGRPLLDFYADTSNGKPRAKRVFQKFRAGEEIHGEELEMCRANGSNVWISLSVRPVFDKEGRVVMSRSEAVDITDKKQTEEKRMAIIETAIDGFWISNMEGRLLEVNDSYCKIVGYTQEELLKKSIWDIEASESYEDTIEHLKELKKQGYTRFETKHRHKNGKVIDVEISANFLDLGEGQVFVFIRDITERKKLDQLKDDFIGLVSHELRSPLTVIAGAVSTVVTEGPLLSEEETHQLLLDASNEIDSLSRLLTNLLELSRAQAGRLIIQYEPVNLKKLLRSVIGVFKGKSLIHRFHLDLPEKLPTIYADQLRLERILYNLLENAVKYSPDSGEIRVSVKVKEEHLFVSVSDQGIGMSKTNQGKLFKPFQRIEDVKLPNIRGLGLGLLVCQRLVESHGGKIWVESQYGRGSIFYFTLPLTKR